MRQSERAYPHPEFPSRYVLDEARFSGGQERIINKEEESYEPATRIPR